MFVSTYSHMGRVSLPEFTGTRVMMLPLVLGDATSVPEFLTHYRPAVSRLFEMAGHCGEVGYLTVDEKTLEPGESTRRPGLHVDGLFHGRGGSWGGGGSWGSVGSGMLTVSSHPGCRVWAQTFDGYPGPDGECDHLQGQLRDEGYVLPAGNVFWLDGLAVHESMPAAARVRRQFVRLSLPSNGPWFEGYTENPLGIRPTGPILPRRIYMEDEAR